MADGGGTDDRLLGGRVRLRQPARGLRTAVDAVLLAAAVPARAGECVLDVGTGVGPAALCLALRINRISVTGLEADPATADLARANVLANDLAARVRILTGDLLAAPEALAGGSFHHVMANPPHLTADRARLSPHPDRVRASIEGAADLAAWVAFATRMAGSRGTVTLIHRADRLDHVLAALARGCGDIRIFPLWPGAGGRPAKRVIVSGRRGSRGPVRLLPGLVLHDAAGGYTTAAEAVLRGGAALSLDEAP